MKYKQLKFLRLRTGREHQWFETFYQGEYIAVGYGLDIDLSSSLYENWRDFNKKFIPEIIKREPNKSRVGAGLNCGVIWTLSKGIEKDSIVLCQDKEKNYHPCKIISNYYYDVDGLGGYHRRRVQWFDKSIKVSEISKELKNSLTAQS